MDNNINLLLYGISILESHTNIMELKSLKRAVIKVKDKDKRTTENLMNILSFAEKLEKVYPNSDMINVILNRAMSMVEQHLKIC